MNWRSFAWGAAYGVLGTAALVAWLTVDQAEDDDQAEPDVLARVMPLAPSDAQPEWERHVGWQR